MHIELSLIHSSKYPLNTNKSYKTKMLTLSHCSLTKIALHRLVQDQIPLIFHALRQE
jgi:hypothetical protein